jgi:hypothetical protein
VLNMTANLALPPKQHGASRCELQFHWPGRTLRALLPVPQCSQRAPAGPLTAWRGQKEAAPACEGEGGQFTRGNTSAARERWLP